MPNYSRPLCDWTDKEILYEYLDCVNVKLSLFLGLSLAQRAKRKLYSTRSQQEAFLRKRRDAPVRSK